MQNVLGSSSGAISVRRASRSIVAHARGYTRYGADMAQAWKPPATKRSTASPSLEPPSTKRRPQPPSSS
eukprot:5410195-Prymnesium_polylepis.1